MAFNTDFEGDCCSSPVASKLYFILKVVNSQRMSTYEIQAVEIFF